MRTLIGLLTIPLITTSTVAFARPRHCHRGRHDVRVDGTPISLVVAGDTLVWTTSFGEIWTRPVKGGKNRQLTEQHADGYAGSLVRTGGRVFAPVDTDVEEIDLATGRPRRMGLALADEPIQLVGDGTALYAVLFQKPAIVRIPIDGGATTTLLSLPRSEIALTPDGATLYAASYTTGVLVSHPTTAGKTTTIARHLPHPTTVEADARYVYVSCETDHTIRRIDPATGDSVVLVRGFDNADQLVSDGGWIYYYSWVAARHGQLLRVAKAGGHEPEILADDLDSPYEIAIEPRSIYLTNRDAGTIVRLAKPKDATLAE